MTALAIPPATQIATTLLLYALGAAVAWVLYRAATRGGAR